MPVGLRVCRLVCHKIRRRHLCDLRAVVCLDFFCRLIGSQNIIGAEYLNLKRITKCSSAPADIHDHSVARFLETRDITDNLIILVKQNRYCSAHLQKTRRKIRYCFVFLTIDIDIIIRRINHKLRSARCLVWVNIFLNHYSGQRKLHGIGSHIVGRIIIIDLDT